MVQLAPLLPLLPFALAANDPFKWHPCPGTRDPQLDCGALTVPLDHLNPNQTIDIAVRRYRTTSLTPKGTIVFCPGGPGNTGVEAAGPKLLHSTGGQHHVVAFDPRGVGASRPVKCTKNGFTGHQEAARLAAKDIPFDTDTSDTSLGRYGAEVQAQVRRCEKYDGAYLKTLSTAYVARDLEAIRVALGADELHYFAYSYGTAVGATYANMFPTRVGKFVLDSVVDPALYTGRTGETIMNYLVDAEAVFEGFAASCQAAGALKCPLAAFATPEASVSTVVRSFLTNLDDAPRVVASTSDDFGILSGANTRRLLGGAMYNPSTWPQVSQYLAALIAGQLPADGVPEVCLPSSSKRDAGMAGLVYIANDGDNHDGYVVDWDAAFLQSKAISPLAGPLWMANYLGLKYWTTTPTERYDGPWNQKLKHRVLLLNNQVDPVTPLAGAHHLAALMGDENAILVTRDGFGHCTDNLPSRCMHDIVASFFNDAKYPPQDTNCVVDTEPFDG
ncbi:Aste57867_15241 [Aphanomyces stellatus]|uniref:Aste57867_15241 protein n=1 Tax=Aphanomyces stellatus TaxID=120398 RepID=A0A485L398_9STRA|nr:hypothetical protein As57867_015185 [Aphanomyces stellatus]VFT92050.1 Aste57867_15241 [Aphanomyces stellatus]